MEHVLAVHFVTSKFNKINLCFKEI